MFLLIPRLDTVVQQDTVVPQDTVAQQDTVVPQDTVVQQDTAVPQDTVARQPTLRAVTSLTPHHHPGFLTFTEQVAPCTK